MNELLVTVARRLDQIEIHPLAEADSISRSRAEIRNMRVEPGVQRYIVDIIRRTRDHAAAHYGASPRAAVVPPPNEIAEDAAQ